MRSDGGGATNPFTALEASDEAQLDRLREAAGSDLVVRLLETSCLLELAKLAPGKLDVPGFTRAAVDVISQFVPLQGCSVSVAPPGLRAAQASIGTLDDGLRLPLLVDETACGHLQVTGVPEFLAGSTMFERATEQLTETLQAVVDAERLRRQAALAGAMRVAGAGDDPFTVPHLRLVVDGLLELPGLLGLTLELRGPAFPQPVQVEGGVRSSFEATREMTLTTQAAEIGSLRAEWSWTVDPTDDDNEAVEAVLRELVASIERATRSRQLIEEAELDPLTGVGNRRRATRALAATLNLAGRSDQPCALLAIDLDHFKRVNDTLGHPAGDAVLQAVAQVLTTEVRVYDVVARIGGDEFVVVCPSTDAAGAHALAERVRLGVPAACAPIIGAEWQQTLSIGVAVSPACGSGPEDVMRWADKALYEAKARGRDSVVVAAASRS
jgi:diguanylate cyclase (GGDEF)-like protein